METETVMFERLIEDTFRMMRELDELDETKDPERAQRLVAALDERAEEIGTLAGFALKSMTGEQLAVCLDSEQAQAVQLALLTVPGGFVTTVEPVMAPLTDFVHPEVRAESVALMLTDEN